MSGRGEAVHVYSCLQLEINGMVIPYQRLRLVCYLLMGKEREKTVSLTMPLVHNQSRYLVGLTPHREGRIVG